MNEPILKAALWMAGTLASFALLGIAGRELADDYTTFQILAFRSVVGLAVMAAVMQVAGWHHARTEDLRWHLTRNVIHIIGQAGWFYGIAYITLAEVFAIEFTAPIWTALLAALFLGERLTALRLVAIGLGFAGILIILRPGVVEVGLASLAVLVGAFAFATAYTFTKHLTARDSALAIPFYMSVVQFPIVVAASLPDWTGGPAWADAPWILLVGATGLSSHFCIAQALRHADASIVMPLDFLRLPLIAAVGFALYGEPFDPWVIGGAAVIFAGTYLLIRDGRVRS